LKNIEEEIIKSPNDKKLILLRGKIYRDLARLSSLKRDKISYDYVEKSK